MDPDSTMFCLILLIVYLLFRVALAAGETVVLYASEARLEHLAEDGDSRAGLLLRLLDDPGRFLATIQSGSVLVGFLTAIQMAQTFAPALSAKLTFLPFQEGGVRLAAVLLLTLLLTILVMLLGTLLPKKLLVQHLDQSVLYTAPLLDLVYRISLPFAALLNGVTNLLLLCFRIDPNAKVEQVTEEEIRLMVDVGNEEGTIEKSEKEMINNIFEFDEKTVAEVMTHRTEMVAVEDTATIIEVAKTAMEEGFSRIPVYEDNIDDIVGVLFVKDLLKYVENPCIKDETIKPFIREVLFVPESKRCTELFKLFKVKKTQIAVVVDEYGGTSGVVTMEDLLEAIVGNMQDEYDDEEEEVLQLSDNEFVLSGALSMEDVEKTLDVELEESEEHDTLGGFVTDLLDRIPGENEHPVVEVDHLRFTVLLVKERRIMKVKAEILPSGEEEDHS